MRLPTRVVLVGLLAWAASVPARSAPPERLFAAANEQARAGDLPQALVLYRQLHDAGVASPSLYWNWGQVAAARGAWGEALWALLRARELEPGDPAIEREIDAAREAANLDVAEIEPEPLGAASRWAARFHLGIVSLVLAVVSLVAHVVGRLRPLGRGAFATAWAAAGLSLVVGLVPLASILARPSAVVVDKAAALVDGASPAAATLGVLREGEVVPVLARSGDYLRVQDSSGARGWAHVTAVRPLAP